MQTQTHYQILVDSLIGLIGLIGYIGWLIKVHIYHISILLFQIMPCKDLVARYFIQCINSAAAKYFLVQKGN